MNLKEELLRGIYAYGFEKPSAIQQRAIVPCIKGMDVIAQAQSGTGGTSVKEDMRKLDHGQHIVVGTPGRVFDMISRKVLRTNDIKQFVLDEADEMLSRGFKDQIYDVFRHLNQEIQVILLSATIPAEVL